MYRFLSLVQIFSCEISLILRLILLDGFSQLWRCFVLLLEEILFLSQGIAFLAMSRSSHVRFR